MTFALDSIVAILIFDAEINHPRSISEKPQQRNSAWTKPSGSGSTAPNEDRKHQHAHGPKADPAEILREYERSGDAMRYLNAKGHIAWKASPWMLARLADAEREVEDDREDRP